MLEKIPFVALFFVGAFTCLATPVMAQDKPAIDRAVKYCVDVVHHFPVNELNAMFFKDFDAFYNPATGRVQNNVIYAGGQAALYQFEKCMASQGLPLGSNE